MVSGRTFTFIAWLMFLIYYDQPQIRKGGKQCRTGTHHYLDSPSPCTFKLIIAFSLGLSGINDRNLLSKPGIEPPHSLISQCNLRNQHNSLLALCKYFLDQPHIYLGLTASGHSLKQYRPWLRLFPFLQYFLCRLLLLPVQSQSRFSGNVLSIYRITKNFIILYTQDSLLFHFSHNSRSGSKLFCCQSILQPFFVQKFSQEPCSRFKPGFFQSFQNFSSLFL